MRAKNYATVLQILISNYGSGPEKLPGLSRNGLLNRILNLNYFVLFYFFFAEYREITVPQSAAQ